MPADVKKAFVAALNKENKTDAVEGSANFGESVINSLVRNKKYVVEAWD